jgi:hypothetical protein
LNEAIPKVSPELFFETANAFQKSAALKAAIDLEIFTATGNGATAEEIAERCKASIRGTRILCDYLTVNGFLTKNDKGYKCTEDSAFFLSKNSPAYVGSAVEFICNPMVREGFEDIAGAVRKGGTTLPERGSLAPEHPMWVTFARAMAPLMAIPAQQMVKLIGSLGTAPTRILDVAANHGMFGITFARQFPSAHVYAVDWPNVLQLAKTNAEKAGLAERYHTIPGSAFDVDLGTNYDIALITNFLHHFDAKSCVHFLKRIHSALAPKGRSLTLEMMPNEDRVSPKLPASFSLIMLANTPGGEAFTFQELEKIHLEAGFSKCTKHLLPPTVQSLLVAEK